MKASMEAIMEAMDSPLLTIVEAAMKTGRSSSTIRRLIRQIAESPSHPDRSGIEPAPKAVEAFKKKGENFTWKIREDLLMKNFPPAQKKAEKGSPSSAFSIKGDILDILRHELKLKNQQIEKQLDVISSLNERLREGNILMGALQQRLAAPQSESPPPVTVHASSMEPAHRSPPRADEGGPSTEASIILKKASKKKVADVKMKVSKEAPRRGMLSWLFR